MSVPTGRPRPDPGRADLVDGAAVDRWTAGLDDADAGRALVLAGLSGGLGDPDPRRPGAPPSPLLDWVLDMDGFRDLGDPRELLGRPDAGRLLEPTAPWAPRWEPLLRVSVRGAVAPAEILPRLLRAPGLDSALLAVDRARGALRRRRWHWPLRIGVLLPDDGSTVDDIADRVRGYGGFPDPLLDLRDVRRESGNVDVLVTELGLSDAVRYALDRQPVANAVVLLGRPTRRWAVVESELATLRAATSAVACALSNAEDLPLAIGRLIIETSHARPVDVALTTAFGRDTILLAEPDAIAELDLPAIARREADDLRAGATAPRNTPAERRELEAAADELEWIARGEFTSEGTEASAIAPATAGAQRRLDTAAGQRWLQCNVGGPGAPPDNVLRRGANVVNVAIGPPDDASLLAPVPFADDALPWDATESFRLTVLLVPLTGDGAQPSSAEIDLPRIGRSTVARLPLHVPDTVTVAAARIVVLFRNRVLQTAVLTGPVDLPARLTEAVALRPTLGGLDDREPFDLALLANHGPTDVATLIAHSSAETFLQPVPAGLDACVDRLSDALAQAVDLPTRAKLDSPSCRALLVGLAQEGADLAVQLGRLPALPPGSRLQIVTARGTWFLPLELVYDQRAPDDGARLCTTYLTGSEACRSGCTHAGDPDFVCPNAFWGMRMSIERHHYDAVTGQDADPRIVVLVEPRRGQSDLTVTTALFGASTKVTRPAAKATLTGLGTGSRRAADWAGWVAELKAEPPSDLLVLLPHTDYVRPSLEISTKTLRRGQIHTDHVTGGHDVAPIVLLFGCQTTGTVDDRAGFASAFMAQHAGMVFASLTPLLGTHAATLARRLVRMLRDPDRPRCRVGELTSAFRADSVRAGELAALAITAYGDADWRV